MLFISGYRPKKCIPWPSEDRIKMPSRIFDTTIGAAKQVGVIGINRGGLKTFKRWYIGRTLHADAFRSSFESREDGHVLRLAALLAINDGTMQIQDKHIRMGYTAISDVKLGAVKLFGGDYTPGARFADGIDKIRQIMIGAGMDGMTHTKLYLKCRWRLDRDEFSLLIKLMHECNMLQVFDRGKKGKFYRATKLMEGSGLTSEVLSRLNLHQP